jgi:hypothetical protein
MSDTILAQILDRLTAIEAGQTELRGAVMARMDRLQTSLDGIRDDLAMIGGANDRVRKAGENTRDEGREVANSLASIERILLKHGNRLDDLERRKP